jgi:hypothetical protein
MNSSRQTDCRNHLRIAGSYLAICRDAQQGVAHHFGNQFQQSLTFPTFNGENRGNGAAVATQ